MLFAFTGWATRRVSARHVTVAISALLLAYVALRAAAVAITHDEALTYAWHVHWPAYQILWLSTEGLPDNNHVLFTLLCKASVAAFGVSEFTLRLPSLLGCALYLVGANLCLCRVAPGWGQVIGVVALGLNPYVVDFLGLARGYGLALGLTMVGVAALLAAVADEPGVIRPGPARVSLLSFALAALANLAFLLVLTVAIAIVTVVTLVLPMAELRTTPDPPPFLRRWLRIMLPILPFLVYLLRPLYAIHEAGLFETGASTGLWVDTVGSLVAGTLHASPGADDPGKRLLLEAWVAGTLLLVVPVLRVLWRTDRRHFAALATLAALLLGIALASVTQHLILGVSLLQGRRGIFLIPLFTLMALALGSLPRSAPSWLAAFGGVTGMLVPGLLGLHGLAALDLKHTHDWQFDAGSREVMVAVGKWLDVRQPPAPVRMRANWILEPAGNFYRRTLGLESSLLPLDRSGVDAPADLYYGERHDRATFARYGTRLLLHAPVAETYLFERAP
jgi:hypothetical protein